MYLFVPLLAFFWLPYPSQAQAKEACWNWMQDGRRFEYTFQMPDLYQPGRTNTYTRVAWEKDCELEESTNQYLGIVYPAVQALPNDPSPDQIRVAFNSKEERVVKNFRF